MPTFLWSGKTASGQEGVESVTAESPELARKHLEARGWTELRQHTTEMNDFIKKQMELASDPEYSVELTPKEDLAFMQGTAPGLWANWIKDLRESATYLLVLGALLLWAIQRHGVIQAYIFGALLFVVIFLFPVLHWWFSATQQAFRQMYQAKTWRRWNDVLQCLEKLQRAQRRTRMGIAETEMANYRALATAGLGRVDEAVAFFTQAADKANMPRWLFHSQLAVIYTVAKQYDKGLESYRQALAEASDKSMVCLDLGVYLVSRFNLPDEAKQLLAQAESAQLCEIARAYLPFLRGAIAFREDDFIAVDKNMREALGHFEKLAFKKSYIFEPVLRICRGYLAVSSAVLGNKEEAKKLFEQSGTYLATVCADDLIERYNKEMQMIC